MARGRYRRRVKRSFRRIRRGMRRLRFRSKRAALSTYYRMRRSGRVVAKPRKSPNKRSWTMRMWR